MMLCDDAARRPFEAHQFQVRLKVKGSEMFACVARPEGQLGGVYLPSKPRPVLQKSKDLRRIKSFMSSI